MNKILVSMIILLALSVGSAWAGTGTGSEHYTVIQGDFSTTVTPLSSAEAVASFYSYNQRFASSSDTGYEKSSTSLLFLYRDTISGELYLFMIHDKPLDSGGGTASFNLFGIPDNAGWVVKDDPAHAPDNYYDDYVTWLWGDCCTDGGVRGDIEGFREITIVPNYWTGINAWNFLTGDVNNPTYINLPSIDEPVIIRAWTEIYIDVKPGSYPNSININNKGVIPVAILTTDDFDAEDVDAETVRFGPYEAYPVHYALEDVDGDGDIDLILHFRTQDTGIAEGDTEAVLTGETYDWHGIKGSDSVKVITMGGGGLARIKKSCAIPQDGLVSWWPGDGDANDLVGQNDGILMNGATFAPGIVDQAFSLDGLDDYIKVDTGPNLTGYSQLSLTAWVNSNPNSGSGCSRIIEFGNDYNDSTALVLDTDCGGSAIGDARAWVHTNGSRRGEVNTIGLGDYNDGQWHFLAFTWDGVNTRLYVDGILMRTGTATGMIDSPSKTLIGQHRFASPDNVNTFGGLIDELTVHDRALTGEEIQTMYDTIINGKCKIGGKK